MKAVLIEGTGKLEWAETASPALRPGYVIVEVRAAGVNRADLLQAAGKYPPPPGWPEWPGLECSGVIAEASPESRWKVGDKVCALLGGGGYAEKALVPEGMVMPVPEGMSFVEAAALPEVYATAMLNLTTLGELKAGETLFVQAGASGLGIAAIQIGKLLGAKVVTAAGSPEKAEAVKKIGADVVINRKVEPVGAMSAATRSPARLKICTASGDVLAAEFPRRQPGVLFEEARKIKLVVEPQLLRDMAGGDLVQQ